jgi:hypothetical protein
VRAGRLVAPPPKNLDAQPRLSRAILHDRASGGSAASTAVGPALIPFAMRKVCRVPTACGTWTCSLTRWFPSPEGELDGCQVATRRRPA